MVAGKPHVQATNEQVRELRESLLLLRHDTKYPLVDKYWEDILTDHTLR